MKKTLLFLILNSQFLIPNSFAQTISGGGYHSLALCSDSTVRAWGDNGIGQLGNGTFTTSNVPVQVSVLSGITAIAAGAGHSLALKNDGTVRAWGSNSFGQLGNGTNTDSNVPVQVSAISGITAITGGGWHSLALKNDGTVWAWGFNLDGELGNGANTNSNFPVQVSAVTSITVIAGGEYHSLALRNDGTVWTWGYNWAGQLGNGTNTDSNVPVQVIGLCQMATGVEEENISTSLNIFPNPISNSTTLSFSLTQSQKVSLKIFDVNGRLVTTLTDKIIEAGEHQIEFNAEKINAGIYFLKMQTGEFLKTEKLIITK